MFENQKLTIKEKFGYGLGDTASNIVFQIVANFMLFFYTDVYGLSAAAAGTLLLVVRVFDGVIDPVMGGIADRTRTKWGTYRPYLLFLSVPYAIFAVLTFVTPDFSAEGKLLYAYVSYALLMICYTAVNIPYSALGGVMTSDPKERSSLQSYRFSMAMLGGVIVVWALPILVEKLGNGSAQQGYQWAMVGLGSLAALCFVACFFYTKEDTENIEPPVKGNMMKDFLSLFKNDQWVLISLISLATLILIGVRSAVAPHFMKYYVGEPSLTGSFMTLGMIGSVVGAVASNFLTKRFEKKTIFMWAMVAVIVTHSLFLFIPGEQVYVIFVVYFLANFAHMLITPIMFSMVADTADYGELQTGKKLTAVTFSGHLLAIKLGFAIGGASAGWILSGFNYVPNQVQTQESLTGIITAFAIMPIICTVITLILAKRYRLTEPAVIDIQKQLMART